MCVLATMRKLGQHHTVLSGTELSEGQGGFQSKPRLDLAFVDQVHPARGRRDRSNKIVEFLAA